MLVKKEYSPIRALLVKQAIQMWSGHKMQITRGFTIKMAMQEARDYTGKNYKANDYDAAIMDLEVMLNPKVVGMIG